VIGGTGSFIWASNVSGLASSRVREAQSGHFGESSEHPTRFRVATWNVGSLKKHDCEMVETFSRRKVNLCGVQEHRWAGGLTPKQTCFIKGKDSHYKFYWCGNKEDQGGVGILLVEHWVDKLFEVVRISDRIIVLRLVIGKAIFTFLSVYAPQSGLHEAVKEHFYDQLQSTVTKVPLIEISTLLGDWNGHVGADASAYNEVYGGHDFGARNSEGERILEFAVAHDLIVRNTLFKKRD